MASLQQIRTLTIQARDEGIAQVRARLEELAASQAKVGDTTEKSTRAQLSAAAAFKRTENALDGETRAARALVAQLDAIKRARDQGMGGDEVRQSQLTTAAYQQYTVAVAAAQRQAAMRSSAANDLFGAGAAQSVKLTANQVGNLGYQLNDVATMLAMGASPFQVISSQAGQVVQALGDGPGGVRGSLSAIGASVLGVLTPVNLLAAGFVSVGAAAAIHAVRGRDLSDVTDIVARQKSLVQELAIEFGLAAIAAEDYGKRSRAELLFEVDFSSAKDLKTLQAETLKLQAILDGAAFSQEFDAMGIATGALVDGRFPQLAGIAGEFGKSIKNGADELAELLRTTKDPALQAFGSQILSQVQNLKLLEEQIKATNRARSQMDARAGTEPRLGILTPRDQFRISDRMDPEARQSLVDDLTKQADDLTKQAEELAKVSDILQSSRDALRDSQTANAVAGLDGYAAGLAEITARYKEKIDLANGSAEAIANLTRARNLDIQSLQVQTQKQLFDPQRDRLASLQAEAAAIGASDDQRRRIMDSLAAENDIRRAGINSLGEQAGAYRANMAALSDYEDAVRRSSEAWDDVRQSGESAIDSLVGSLTDGDFAGALKGIADDFAKTALELAVANPLKNALLGTSYGTINDLFADPKAPGLNVPAVQSVAAMSVTAAVVNLNGAGVGAAGAIDRLPNPANGNAPAGGMAKYRDAIASIESAGSGDYSALGPVTRNGDRAYGRYQMMGANIGPWSQQALGQSIDINQFMANPAMQDKIFDHIFGGYVGKYGETGASQAWFGGPGSVGKLGRQDMLGTSIGGYGEKFQDALGKLETSAPQLAESATAFTNDFSQITGQVNAGIGQIADQFVPGFGGILTKILDGMQQPGGGGGIGGIFGSLFGGGASAGTIAASAANPLGKLGFYAAGTDSAPGGMAWVGERGPELMNVPRGAQIIPNHVLASMSQARGGAAAAAPAMNFSTNITLNASGGTPEQNADLARQTRKELEKTMRGVVVQEVGRQLRSGGNLSKAG